MALNMPSISRRASTSSSESPGTSSPETSAAGFVSFAFGASTGLTGLTAASSLAEAAGALGGSG